MDRLVALALLAVVVGASLLGTALVGPPGLKSTITVTQTVTSTNLETWTSEVTRTATQLNFPCKGRAKCWEGTVTKIIDGDTLEIDSTRVRLALVDAPESGQSGFSESLEFVKRLCPVGSEAVIDQDDKQLTDKFGRMLAVIWCSGKNVNAELLYAGLGRIDTRYCMQSEFRGEEWAKKYGC